MTQSEEDKSQLPCSPHYQKALIGWINVDEKFFRSIIDIVEPEWFVDGTDSKLYGLHKKWWKDNKIPPQPYIDDALPGDILTFEQFAILDEREKRELRNRMRESSAARSNTSKEAISSELNTWYKSRIYHEMARRSSNLYNNKRYPECYTEVRKAIDKIETTNFGTTKIADFGLSNIIKEKREEHMSGLSFGLNLIDGHLVEAAQGNSRAGGLLKGDTTIIMAPVNTGKTSCLLTVAAHNIFNGRRVILTTHEGRELDIKLKLWCIITRCNRTELEYMWKHHREQMLEVQSKFEKYLTYLPRNISNGTIEETIASIRILHNKDPFDLWVDDYPGTITTVQAGSGKLTRRERDDIVYGQVVDLAGELGFHSLCAIQTNREGSKINRKISEEGNRLLTMEDVSESWGPMMRATNVITLNRDPMAASKDYLTFYICKSRSSRTGIAVVCKSRYDMHVTHSEFQPDMPNKSNGVGEFGAYSYDGTESHSDKAEGFLKMFRGKFVTFEDMRASTKIIKPA